MDGGEWEGRVEVVSFMVSWKCEAKCKGTIGLADLMICLKACMVEASSHDEEHKWWWLSWAVSQVAMALAPSDSLLPRRCYCHSLCLFTSVTHFTAALLYLP